MTPLPPLPTLDQLLVDILDTDPDVPGDVFRGLFVATRYLARHPDVARKWADAIMWDLDGPPCAVQPASPSAADQRPHSRACVIRRHDHGPECHPNCPTCRGKA